MANPTTTTTTTSPSNNDKPPEGSLADLKLRRAILYTERMDRLIAAQERVDRRLEAIIQEQEAIIQRRNSIKKKKLGSALTLGMDTTTTNGIRKGEGDKGDAGGELVANSG